MASSTLKYHILVVDDDPDILDLVGKYVDDKYQISKAYSAEEGYEGVLENPPHMILLDVKLPEKDGLWMLKKVRESHPEILVAMITGYSDLEVAIRALRIGAFDFLKKPFSRQDIESFLERASARLDMEKELLAARKKNLELDKFSSLSLMSASISHDILNPITIILGNTRILAGRVASGKFNAENALKSLDKIQSGAEKVSDICQNLSALAKGLRDGEFKTTPLKSLFWDVATMATSKLESAGIKFSVEDLPKTYRIDCRRVDISHALLCLVFAAEEYLQTIDSCFKEIILSAGEMGQSVNTQILARFEEPSRLLEEGQMPLKPVNLAAAKRFIEDHNGKLKMPEKWENQREISVVFCKAP